MSNEAPLFSLHKQLAKEGVEEREKEREERDLSRSLLVLIGRHLREQSGQARTRKCDHRNGGKSFGGGKFFLEEEEGEKFPFRFNLIESFCVCVFFLFFFLMDGREKKVK